MVSVCDDSSKFNGIKVGVYGSSWSFKILCWLRNALYFMVTLLNKCYHLCY